MAKKRAASNLANEWTIKYQKLVVAVTKDLAFGVSIKACVSYRSSAYFRSARKSYINIEITKNSAKKFKAHFKKKV